MNRAIADKQSWHWKHFEKNLAELKQISVMKGSDDIIFFYLNGALGFEVSDYRNLPPRFDNWNVWQYEMEQAAARQGFITLNAIEEIKTQTTNEILAVNQFDYHPNEKLHQIYASVLSNKIRELTADE